MATGSVTQAQHTLLRLGLLAALHLGLFVAVYVLTVRTVAGRLLADTALRGALLTSTPLDRPVERILDVISVASLAGVVAVVAVIALVRLARLPGIAAVGLLVAANVSTLLLKDYLLTRPDLDLAEVTPATLNSLPSGHATAAFSAVVALLVVLPRAWRPTAAVVGAAYATVTALATMSAGWHRAGDAVASFLLVGFWAMLAAVFLLTAGEPDRAPPRHVTAPHLLVVTSVLALPGAALVSTLLTLVPPLRDSGAGEPIALLGAACAVAGTAAAVMVAVVHALDRADPLE